MSTLCFQRRQWDYAWQDLRQVSVTVVRQDAGPAGGGNS